MKKLLTLLLVLYISLGADAQSITGTLQTWHKVTLTFDGPQTSEYDTLNPFLHYRLEATFSNGEQSIRIPGFYAADGNAAETSAKAGNKWQVRFAAPSAGQWTYTISFRKGKHIAIIANPTYGTPVAFDGATGTLTIAPSDKPETDLRRKGRLVYTGEPYFRFAGTNELYLKGGANSPENLLGYYEFDDTPASHRFEAHAGDYKPGDPTWKNGKGKNLIGALNYLSTTGMNAVYFLTMNVMGDGKDVWPWTDQHERYRFDCSKLDQWEVIFDHMDNLGLIKHVITQETENENLLDIGQTGIQRKLYYRELVARFAHHPGIVWNMGEENGITHWSPIGQTDKLRKDMIGYMRQLDTYGNPVVIHTLPSLKDHDRTMTPLLGDKSALEGVSFQIHHLHDAYATTKKWRQLSADSSRQWVIWIDEIGPAGKGVLPDDFPGQQDTVRKYVIWANLMAGGAGVEHYFGYKYAHNDLKCEDWRSRDRIWQHTAHALGFFKKLPLKDMQPNTTVLADHKGWCLSGDGSFVIYLPNGGNPTAKLPEGRYHMQWYNPRTGAFTGKKARIKSDGEVLLTPPADQSADWAVLFTKD
ncbi:DUF5060 domain-containing protein [Marinoscillum furvescens]|uniref:Collagenase-like protein with putative collagen-binding domain n=1 Tax=Marinoscillum furvescens DSM 4134 TaxID=1122208 RepID=A0A3D9KZ74_MARFU|nr:DUF5060 domain-containing protein [Marinoscillum furvescens]RED93004.1 collagenase-like protein with putative collagen-binding domain [Marinoscillum furvescens DSM 4134]